MKGERIISCTLQQSLYLVCIAQIGVKNPLIIGWKESTLKKLLHAPPCHHGRFALASPCDLQLVPPCGSSFELVRHELDMLFLEDVSHVKELIYLINPVEEGFDIKIPTERKNLNFHLYSLEIGSPLPLSELGKGTLLSCWNLEWPSALGLARRPSFCHKPHFQSLLLDIMC